MAVIMSREVEPEIAERLVGEVRALRRAQSEDELDGKVKDTTVGLIAETAGVDLIDQRIWVGAVVGYLSLLKAHELAAEKTLQTQVTTQDADQQAANKAEQEDAQFRREYRFWVTPVFPLIYSNETVLHDEKIRRSAIATAGQAFADEVYKTVTKGPDHNIAVSTNSYVDSLVQGAVKTLRSQPRAARRG